jgi:hypothetical protein
MARYGAGFSVSGTNTANTQTAALFNVSTTDRLYVVEVAIGVVLSPTTAPSFYLSRGTARGTQTTTLAGLPHDPADGAANGTVDTAWSVAPTFSTSNQIRRGGMGTAQGGFLVWTFYDAPIVIDRTASSGLVLADANASGATVGTFTGYFSWEE